MMSGMRNDCWDGKTSLGWKSMGLGNERDGKSSLGWESFRGKEKHWDEIPSLGRTSSLRKGIGMGNFPWGGNHWKGKASG